MLRFLRDLTHIRLYGASRQVRGRQRGVVVSLDRACCLCHRRMGTSALVVYPNNMLAHYACYKRQAPVMADSGGSDSPLVALGS